MDLDADFMQSAELRAIREHLLELVQTSTQSRLAELRTIKEHLPENVYSQRKANILRSLRKLMPGGASQIEAVRDEDTGEVLSDPLDIGRILTKYWQQVFDKKQTNSALRRKWLDKLKAKLEISLDDLRPTRADIDQVLNQLPNSAPGPDGIPFSAFRRIKGILAPVLFDVIQGMISGTEVPYEEFNKAFLTLLAKTEAEVHDPGGTRPLSIVDSVNRIIASIFQITLERAVGSFIHSSQRGFIRGRSMLRNVLDIDFAAQTISIKHQRGAIILFDFRAAFPSLCHDFLWEALEALGIPQEYIRALQMFYVENKHILRVGGIELESITVHSGVRQGCPLSPILSL